MSIVISNVLNGLRNGNLNLAYEYKSFLNDIALSIYNKQSLSKEDIENLKNIILICNITYNDTDRELLPFDDGFYDLLLEKYKTYDPNFQVGAEVLNFESSKSNNKIFVEKPMKEALIFNEDISDKEFFFKDDIIINPMNYIDHRDFERISAPISNDYISKRLHDTEHNHPELVGTLDKCKFVLDRDASIRGVLNDSNVKTVERDFFQDHLKRGIIRASDQFDIVLELKYDGISVEADCTDEVVSARSRGDTGIGKASDFTPFLKGYKFPHRDPGSPMIGVKFEAIITQNDLPYFNMAKGYDYKNCRSAIVGLLSSSDAWKYRDFITLVPLAVEEKVFVNQCNSDRVQEIEFLNRNFVTKGCPLRYTFVRGTYIENLAWINIFTQNAESLRGFVPFMYDGIVVSYRDPVIRNKLGRENFINKYSIAVKFNPLKKETIFRGYTYTIGQDGSITPMIHYDPVEFYGTIHNKSSGHSYARFKELDLHLGDIISVEYVNDVMPYVSKPMSDYNIDLDKQVPPEIFPNRCPVCGSEVEISNSGKSVKCLNPNCGGRQLSRMVNMFAKFGLNGFGEATVAQLGYYHLKDLMVAIKEDSNWYQTLQNKGFGPVEIMNIVNELDNLLIQPLEDSKLLGAIGFTGLSTKTWELILPKIRYQKLKEVFNMDSNGYFIKSAMDYISEIKGIGPSTVDIIEREFKYFEPDLDWMYSHANIIEYQQKNAKKIRFSGFRDKEYCNYLNSIGFDADDNGNLTKDCYILLVPNTEYKSNKTLQAEKFGIQIVPIDEFRNNINKYL